jgi:hypothetical protein
MAECCGVLLQGRIKLFPQERQKRRGAARRVFASRTWLDKGITVSPSHLLTAAGSTFESEPQHRHMAIRKRGRQFRGWLMYSRRVQTNPVASLSGQSIDANSSGRQQTVASRKECLMPKIKISGVDGLQVERTSAAYITSRLCGCCRDKPFNSHIGSVTSPSKSISFGWRTLWGEC